VQIPLQVVDGDDGRLDILENIEVCSSSILMQTFTSVPSAVTVAPTISACILASRSDANPGPLPRSIDGPLGSSTASTRISRAITCSKQVGLVLAVQP